MPTAPTTTRRLLATGLAAATMALLPVGSATAAPAPAAPAPATATDDCLAAGRVWLVVQDHTGKLLQNTCVDKGANGTAVLTNGGVKLTKDSKGFICAMDGEPAACPAKFDGNYWQYWIATPATKMKWTMSAKGADDSKPAAGSIEGWCYGKQCTPAMPAVAGSSAMPTASASGQATESASAAASASETVAASPSSDASAASNTSSSSSSSSTPWGAIGTVVVLALLALVGWLVARNRRH